MNDPIRLVEHPRGGTHMLSEYGLIVRSYREGMLKGKTVVIGFPGMALVGKVAADTLAEKLGMEPVARMYTFYGPGSVAVDKGILKPAEITILSSPRHTLAVVTSGFQPPDEQGQNRVAHGLLDYLSYAGAREVIAAAAYVNPQPSEERKVFVAASSKPLLDALARHGDIEMEGAISGLNGLVPGLAPIYGMDGGVVLGETGEIYVAGGIVDYRAAAAVARAIAAYAGLELDLADLLEQASRVEEQIRASIAAAAREEKEKEQGKGEGGPVTYM